MITNSAGMILLIDFAFVVVGILLIAFWAAALVVGGVALLVSQCS